MANEAPTTNAPMTGSRPAERALAAALRTVFGALRVIMIIVLVALLFSNTRIVQQNQRAVILRFGRVVGTGAARARGPGLVFAWPQPIDEIIVVDAGRTQIMVVDDFMYRKEAREGGTESLGESLQTGVDGYSLTGDANIIHSIWTVRYKVSDVVKYAFNARDPERLIRRSLAAAVVHSCLDFGVEEALWRETESLRFEVHQRLQERLNLADCGIEIDDLDVTLEEPKQTTEAFEKARRVKEEVGEQIEKAWRYRYALLNATAGDAGEALAETLTALADAEEALADAEEALAAAEAEGSEAVSEADLSALKDKIAELRAQADGLYEHAGGKVVGILSDGKEYAELVKTQAVEQAKVFKRLNHRFEQHPRILVQRLHAGMIEQLLSQSGSKYFLYPRDQREIRILLEELRKPEKPKEEESVIKVTPEERERSRRGGP